MADVATGVSVGVPVCPAEMSGQVTSYTKSNWVEVSSLLPSPPCFILTELFFAPMYFVLRSSAQLRNLQIPHHLPRPEQTWLLQYFITIVFRFCAASPCAVWGDVRRKLRSFEKGWLHAHERHVWHAEKRHPKGCQRHWSYWLTS